MFCTNCGQQIDDDAKFCRHCGTSVQSASPANAPAKKMSMSSPPKKTISPAFIGIILAAALAAAAAVGGILYVTSRGTDDTEKVEVSSEKTSKKKEAPKEDASIPETDDTEEPPAATATKELLQDYLDTELIPQYGTANLSAQTKTFDSETVHTEAPENPFWTTSAGLSDARIYDLDQDGDEELLVFLLTEENVTLCIYEAEDGKVHQTVEFPQERCTDIDGFDLSWSLLTADGIPYLFYQELNYGLIWDYSDTNAGLYRYDGQQLYAPLVIAQTAGGSSDFVFTAYQYSPEGELLNEEVVYGMDSESGPDYSMEYYFQRVAELFDTYGIHLDSNIDSPLELDIYQNITDADDYEVLLQMEMWADYLMQDDSYFHVYHFNDFDSPIARYRRFLAGKETVQMREGVWYYGDAQAEWSVYDIQAELANSYLSGTDRLPYIQYTYLDCGGDGVEELAIRFVGLDIYAQDDDSDCTMIITCSGDLLEVVYTCESWARSYTSPLYHGCIPSSGSAGAGDHPFDMEYLDADGNLHTVYDAEELGGIWFRRLDPDIYDTVFGSDEPNAAITHYYMNGTDYLVVQTFDDLPDPRFEEYASLCEQKGMRFVSRDEILELIEQYAGELGIETEWLYEEELSWNYSY